MRVHLDTDFGGDPDDACALAMLLGWPGVEITGVTTNLDVGGRRAGCVAHYLSLAGRSDIPVAAGAGASMTTLARHPCTWGDPRYWPDPVGARPTPAGAASALLAASIDSGAAVIAIGALTNLALLEIERPGTLRSTTVVVMGGWLDPPAPGLPPWGPELDWNVQCDPTAMSIVHGAGPRLTLVPLPVAMAAHLRTAHLPRLRAAGPVGALLARQSEAHAQDTGMGDLARAHIGLPDDLVNFHWDPLTCAVAAGWPGAQVAERSLTVHRGDGGVLLFRDDPAGLVCRTIVEVDGGAFAQLWLDAINRAAGDATGGRAGGAAP